MNRNIFLLASIILFWFVLHATYNWIPIMNKNQAKDIYMSNKKQKIKRVEVFHKAAKDNYIFAKMMANNKGTLINAVIKNHPKFWEAGNNGSIQEGLNSKFDKLFNNIIKESDLKIDVKQNQKLGKSKYAGNTEKQEYFIELNCEYHDLVALIAALEKNDRIYNIDKLSIKNPLQKNNPGIAVYMNLHEINIGN